MMKRAFLIFSLVLMTALAGCGNGEEDTPSGGGETGGDTGGSAAVVFNLAA